MSYIGNGTPVLVSEKRKNSRVSGPGIVALILSILGVTIILGAIVAIIDLFDSDDNKKICSTIAMCICGVWLFVFIVGGMLRNNIEVQVDMMDIPEEYQSVMEKAMLFNESQMSKAAIHDTLTWEHGLNYTEEEARYALDHIDADWYAYALANAEIYSERLHMSEAGIYNQLTGDFLSGDQFTEDEARYAMEHLYADWDANALAAAQNISDVMHKSKEWIYYYLIEEYPNGSQYTEEQAQYAIDHVEADWKESALLKAEEYREYQNMSLDEIYERLTLHYWEYGDGFTAEEAQYAISNLK